LPRISPRFIKLPQIHFVIRFCPMNGKERSRRVGIGQRLWWLIAGRAAIALILLLGGALWARGTLGPNIGNSFRLIKPIILTVGLLTIIYSALHLLWRNYRLQARIQFVVDVLLVTWLIWITGTVHSPYTAL